MFIQSKHCGIRLEILFLMFANLTLLLVMSNEVRVIITMENIIMIPIDKIVSATDSSLHGDTVEALLSGHQLQWNKTNI